MSNAIDDLRAFFKNPLNVVREDIRSVPDQLRAFFKNEFNVAREDFRSITGELGAFFKSQLNFAREDIRSKLIDEAMWDRNVPERFPDDFSQPAPSFEKERERLYGKHLSLGAEMTKPLPVREAGREKEREGLER